MKFQNRSIHGSKVNRRTDRQTDRQAESNMPFQLFQSWGHKNLSSNYGGRIIPWLHDLVYLWFKGASILVSVAK